VVPRIEGGVLAIVDDVTVFVRGDANGDRAVDIGDPVFTLSFLFLGGAAPSCPDAADADDSGIIELTDAVVILGQLFTGGAKIAAPYPQAGGDYTLDGLGTCTP
jgi:hypothetical protein